MRSGLSFWFWLAVVPRVRVALPIDYFGFSRRSLCLGHRRDVENLYGLPPYCLGDRGSILLKEIRRRDLSIEAWKFFNLLRACL